LPPPWSSWHRLGSSSTPLIDFIDDVYQWLGVPHKIQVEIGILLATLGINQLAIAYVRSKTK